MFRYITFRTGGAMVTGALVVFMFGPWIIDQLRLAQGKGQPIRADGPPTHLVTKKGTPTMGGLMILSGLIVATLLWANLRNAYVWIVLLVTLGFGFVGFYDDYLKVSKQTDKGFSGRSRLAVESLIALIACACIVWFGRNASVTAVSIPFVKEFMLNIGWFYVMFGMFIIVGAGNAGEPDRWPRRPRHRSGDDRGGKLRHDRLSGRQCGCSLSIFKFATWRAPANSRYCAARCWAQVSDFSGSMRRRPRSLWGDTGSLALGGMLGAIAVATKHEIVLAVIGGLFVVEALSVIVQVASFKLTGKRFFRMAPIHHHYEQKGWTEPQIVIRFWIVSVMLALAGLSTLKLR